ncbi:1-acyl-sn-glycerol-3-phosphate acyltransferase gamma-like [Paramacrobiotus metropolitanus]|uniref:1-acyl-sn-glycerol-3-phosphate acyltransferase gamma-like n=1 Tax=Paramacrobiotus metropolitanus TaxID=2943436 RepID=UPI002445A117|nr:1-acyl-sn-glycerol-3-phosphate acyltransferase gamma-like [Paramacrobiotus metropolitanus]
MEQLAKWKELPIFAVIFVTIFLVSGILMSGGLFLASIIIWPFSRYYYRQISYYFIYPVWAQLVFLIDWWAPSEVILYTDEAAQKHIGTEHAMVVMNHSYDIDWLAGWLICERAALLAATKVFAKRSLSYVPVIGWLWRLGEIIFLDRNWQKDRTCIANQIAQISQYANPVWILLFPEGTRFTPSKHSVSMEFAKKEGLPMLKHLLTPRTRGFVLTMQAIKESGNKIRAIYDTTIGFANGPGINEPTLSNLIKGRPVQAHMKVSRIPMENVPSEEKDATEWLHKSFVQRDKLLEQFEHTNRFEGRHYLLPRRPYTLLNEIFWIVTVIGGALYYSLTTPWIPWWFLPLMTAALSVALHYLINVTVSKKGSTYGKATARNQEGRIITATEKKDA